MTRKPSPSRLAKGLERAAHEAERYATKLRELGALTPNWQPLMPNDGLTPSVTQRKHGLNTLLHKTRSVRR